MTREEAIRILDPETTGEAIAEIEYYGGFNGKTAAVQAVSDACVLAVAALREQEERRWIPVTERLPSIDETILVYDGDVGTGIFYKGAFQTFDENGYPFEISGVTHWMPLPQPPKG